MLSDRGVTPPLYSPMTSLNAPFGTGCFLTHDERDRLLDEDAVLMHLLVLGAF